MTRANARESSRYGVEILSPSRDRKLHVISMKGRHDANIEVDVAGDCKKIGEINLY